MDCFRELFGLHMEKYLIQGLAETIKGMGTILLSLSLEALPDYERIANLRAFIWCYKALRYVCGGWLVFFFFLNYTTLSQHGVGYFAMFWLCIYLSKSALNLAVTGSFDASAWPNKAEILMIT